MERDSFFQKLLIIGGSAGALEPLQTLLAALPQNCPVPVIVVLHRQRNVESNLRHLLARCTPLPVVEPEDKEAVQPGHIYLAPQNYHLLLEADGSFALDAGEPIAFSRPSIDVTLQSAALLPGVSLLAILLSGANSDGAAGIKEVLEAGGTALVQAPETALFPLMPEAALAQNGAARAMGVGEMGEWVGKKTK